MHDFSLLGAFPADRAFADASFTSNPQMSADRALANASAIASKTEVEAAFSVGQLDRSTSGRLLPASHPQLLQINRGLEYHYQPDELHHAALFSAASSVAHHTDAWSYFTQATRAIIAGDLNIARHLLYYSELRSTFSILSRHGIIIRSNSHVVIQDGELTEISGVGTHRAVWKALKAWMKTAAARELFLNSIRFSGQPVADWLDASGSFQQQSMVEIFRLIGFDLSLFDEDRISRNTASYGARFLRDQPDENLPDWFVPEIRKIWDLLQPIGNSGFDQLDAEYSALIINAARRSEKRSMKKEKYTPHANALASAVSATQPELASKLLLEMADGSHKSLFQTSLTQTEGPHTNADDIRAMVGRALLLARFAGASVEDLVVRSGHHISSLDFVFVSAARQTGLWNLADGERTLIDLFDDASSDADELVAELDSASFADFLGAGAAYLHGATNFSIAGMWIRGSFETPLPTDA